MPIQKIKGFSYVDKFLISQFTFLNTVTGFQWLKRIVHGVPVLKSRDCRRFFFGQFISNIGSWMQVVALGWLVFQTTDSPFWVGVVAATSSIPALFFSLFGGSIVDHFPKKKVLLFANSAAMILAFILGFLTLAHVTNLPILLVISFLAGAINSIYTPAHFSYIPELAGKKTLTSAMAVNSSVSSLGRVLGPIFAGLYIKVAGTGGAFIINGISYLAVIAALLMIKSKSKVVDHHLNPLKAIQEGLVYSMGNPMIRSVIIYVASASIFAWSYTTIIPVVAKSMFNADAAGMSYLYSAVGIGSILATVLVTVLTSRLSKLSLFLFGNSVFAISIFLFTFTKTLPWGLVCMFFSGLGLVIVNIVLGTMIQHMADPQYRGRVTSIYFLVYGGVLFLGNLEIGFVTEHFGAPFALRFNTSIILFIGVYILFIREKLRESQKAYNKLHQIT